jgi:hypothetical protein
MQGLPGRQKGASPIVALIVLVLFGYGIYVGIQYVPQLIESHNIDSILNDIENGNKANRIDSIEVANLKVVNMLQVNEMNDMNDSYTVKNSGGRISIEFNYERELNLGFEIKPIRYRKTLILN